LTDFLRKAQTVREALRMASLYKTLLHRAEPSREAPEEQQKLYFELKKKGRL